VPDQHEGGWRLRTLPERIAFHAARVASADNELTAERAALHDAIIDTLRDRDDDGTPRWPHEQILDALLPLVAGQDRPPEPLRRPPHMKGQRTFSAAQAEEISDTLRMLQRARDAGDRPQAKALGDRLRRLGFYISDWQRSPHRIPTHRLRTARLARAHQDHRRRQPIQRLRLT
jgi:hypothetical protein